MEIKLKFLLKVIFSVLFVCWVSGCNYFSKGTQIADPDFTPKNTHKTFSDKNSPVVYIDEAHHNFLTKSARYQPFAQVLESDGYTLKSNNQVLTLGHLNQADILVIANALDKERKDWNPPYGDAFKPEEVTAIKEWVLQGGSLFLIADHTPFPRAIEKLAAAFGFKFSNGHVGNATFKIHDKTLADHNITQGATESKNELGMFVSSFSQNAIKNIGHSGQITKIKTFGGSAFKTPNEAISLLTLGSGAVSINPAIPFQVNSETPRLSVNGWSQGAVLEFGKGRVAVFAEGMMFSSQLETKTGKRYGLSSKGAEQNEQFLLNIMHWLSKRN